MVKRRKIKVGRARFLLNNLSLSVVSGMAFVIVAGMMSDPPNEFLSSGTSPTPGIKNLLSREPAAVKSNDEVASLPNSHVETLDILCDSEIPFISQSETVRLKGTLCNRKDGLFIEVSHIKNKSNGATATVFQSGNTYMTDLIRLAKGENVIVIQHHLRGPANAKAEPETLLRVIQLQTSIEN